MSNLGSYGNADQESHAANIEKQSQLVSSDDLHAHSYNVLNQLIQSADLQDHETAMKMLFAMMSKGLDVSTVFTFVVQQVASSDAVTRQLAYIYLNHYAEENPETAILSLNTFQKSLSDSDPLVRASAIKVMSSIRSREILPAIQSAVNQIIGDPSPYVKKAAAYAMIKASEMEPQEITNYLPLIGFLLGDSSPIAFSGAIAAYWALSPDNVDLLHPHIRSICQNITKLDEYAQILTLRALTVYSRRCFKNPEAKENDGLEDDTTFWDDTGTNEHYSDDHLLLVHAAKRLLTSLNSGVVLAAVSLLFYIAPSSHISSVARPLVRLLYENNDNGATTNVVTQMALSTILTVAIKYPHIFIPHLNNFFVRRGDAPNVKLLKLKVIALLATPTNASFVLNELSTYAGSSDPEFAATAVKTMGRTSLCNQAIIPQCLGSLLRLMNRAEGNVLNEVVMVIAHILRQRRGTEDEAQALKKLCTKFMIIKDASARTAVLSIVGDMHETHPEFAPQLLRHIALYYFNEQSRVRLQALTLASKLITCGVDSKIPMYVLKIGEKDVEYDIRDKAHFLLALILNKADEINGRLKEILFPPIQIPQWTDLNSGSSLFQIGTFSHFFNRAFLGYEPLPEWAPDDQIPDESVRRQVKVMPDGTKMIAICGDDYDDIVDIDKWFEVRKNINELNVGTSLTANNYITNNESDEYYSNEESSYSYSYSENEQEDNEEQIGFFD